jgi:cytochrome oxidase Cu insertion factor (SCO1/SenC/PrrC family)
MITELCMFAWKLESKHDSKIVPVFVTIDPQRDNPSQLRAYLKGESSPTTESVLQYANFETRNFLSDPPFFFILFPSL